jgi:hypothetical protein
LAGVLEDLGGASQDGGAGDRDAIGLQLSAGLGLQRGSPAVGLGEPVLQLG